MLLGQLYYFDKVLEGIEKPLTLQAIDKIDIAGIGVIESGRYTTFTTDDWCSDLRDKFILGFQNVLADNQFVFGSLLWSAISSSKISTEELPEPVTDFESEITAWLSNGCPQSELGGILKSGKLATIETDFALYYGLHVLDILSNQSLETVYNLDLNVPAVKIDTDQVLNSEADICVFASNYLRPLFVNLNCYFHPKLESNADILEKIQKVLKTNPNVKMILIENLDTAFQRLLSKKLPHGLIISSIDLDKKDTESYFDRIVKKTLGVRLT